MNQHWHTQTAEQVAAALGVDPGAGLDDRQVEQARERHGPNRLVEQKTRGVMAMLLGQFSGLNSPAGCGWRR